MQAYAVTYSYPTSDLYHRGQCSTVVQASSKEHAVWLIIEECWDAQIVRVAKVKRGAGRTAVR